jgi:NAD kinase
MLQKVAIFSKDNNSKTRDGVDKLVDELKRRSIQVQVFHKTEDPRPLSGLPDLVLSVGGDGTFLETVLKFRDLGVPVAGVNTGRMGFLAIYPVRK